MGEYEDIFKFSAKAGSLEGYLYEREKVEPLHIWVENIGKMYRSLPGEVKDDIKGEFGDVLKRILTNGDRSLEQELKTKLNSLLSEVQG